MDTTTSAIAKRIAEARERVFPAMYRPFNCSDCRKDVPALADTLEAVTADRDDEYKIRMHNAECANEWIDRHHKLAGQLEAVTRERDDARDDFRCATYELKAAYGELEAVTKERDALKTFAETVPCTCGHRLYKMEHNEHYHSCLITKARAALASRAIADAR